MGKPKKSSKEDESMTDTKNGNTHGSHGMSKRKRVSDPDVELSSLTMTHLHDDVEMVSSSDEDDFDPKSRRKDR